MNTIALIKNTCFDILKKRNKLRYDDISLYINFIKDEKDTEMIILKNLTSKSIRVALMKIPEKYRVLLYMFYFEELKISEISTILNEKENTIKLLNVEKVYYLKKNLNGNYLATQ